MVKIIIAFSLLAFIIGEKLNYDLHYKIRHGKEWLYMALASIPSIVLLSWATSLNWGLAAILSAFICSGTILFWFNGLFNVLRKQDWWFTGTAWQGQSWSDNLFSRVPKWLHIFIVSIFFIGPIIIYIFTF